jgi:hypothetical protein
LAYFHDRRRNVYEAIIIMRFESLPPLFNLDIIAAFNSIEYLWDFNDCNGLIDWHMNKDRGIVGINTHHSFENWSYCEDDLACLVL